MHLCMYVCMYVCIYVRLSSRVLPFRLGLVCFWGFGATFLGFAGLRVGCPWAFGFGVLFWDFVRAFFGFWL